MVNLLSDGAAGADGQAGRHRRHPRRPGRGDRRRRRALRAGPLLRRLARIDLDLDLWARASQRQPGLLRPVRPRPDLPRSCATPPTSACRGADDFDPRAARPREGGRAAARAGRVPAGGGQPPPSCASRTGSRATSRTPPATYHRFYDDCRVLPHGRRGAGRPAPGPAAARRRDPDRARQRARACSASPRPSGCEPRARPRGRLGRTPTGRPAGPVLAARARRPQRAGPAPVVARPRTRSTACSSVGGRDAAPTWSPSTAPRRTSSTRPTSGPGPAPSATPSRRTTSSTPARRSSARRSPRWVAEEGLSLDVCSGGELAVALRAGFDPARIGFHGNNKTVRRAAPRGRRRGRPDRRRLVRRDRPAGRGHRRARARPPG